MVSTRKSFAAPSSPAHPSNASSSTTTNSRELRRLTIDANVDGLLGKRSQIKQEQPRPTYSWRGSIYEIQGDEPPDFFEHQSSRYLKRVSTHVADGDTNKEKERPAEKKREISAAHPGEVTATPDEALEQKTPKERKRKRAMMEQEDNTAKRDELPSTSAALPAGRYNTFSLSNAQPPPDYQPARRRLRRPDERYCHTAIGSKEDMASIRSAKKSAKDSGLNVKAFSQAELDRNRTRNQCRTVLKLIKNTANVNAEIREKQKEYAKLVGNYPAWLAKDQKGEYRRSAMMKKVGIEREIIVSAAGGDDYVKDSVDFVMELSKDPSPARTASSDLASSADTSPRPPMSRPRYDSVTAESLTSPEAPVTKGRCEEQMLAGRMFGESLAAKEKREERERDVLLNMLATVVEEGRVLDL